MLKHSESESIYLAAAASPFADEIGRMRRRINATIEQHVSVLLIDIDDSVVS